MIERAKQYARQHWREFSESRPGKRFQDRYRRRQEHGHGRFGIRRIANIALGVVIVLVSAVAGVFPGPGWGTAFIGFGLIAGEVLAAARFLDRLEVWLRRFGQTCRDIWNIANPIGKALISLLILACVGGLGFAIYKLIIEGFISSIL